MAERVAAWWVRRLPGPVAIFAVSGTALVCIVAVVHGLSDPDYYWHLTVGRLIAETGRVPTSDLFSFTWAGQPWTAHEWLGELLMYALVRAVGPVVTMVAFGIAGMAGPALLAATLRRHGAGVPAIGLGLLLAAWIMLGYATIRPQVLSWALLGVLVAILMDARPRARGGRPRVPLRVLGLPLLFGLWANLHGLWIAGLGVLGIFVVFTLAYRTTMAPVRGRVLAVGVASTLACALTPAGLGTLTYPLRYVDPGDWGLDHIAEWQSPNFHDPTYWSVLVLVLLIAVGGGRRPAGWLRVCAALGAAGSLLAIRNAPVGLMVGLPVVVLGLDELMRLPGRLAARLEARSEAGRLGRRLVLLELAIGLVAVATVVVPILPAARATFPSTYPVAGVDILLADQPEARVLAEYGWGGYVLSRIHDAGGRVFVDGRNDMYPERILDDYSTIRDAGSGWPALMDRYGVTAVLLPPGAGLVAGPLSGAGWCTAYRDAVQVLMLPTCP